MKYIGNAFSLQMLSEYPSSIKVEELTEGQFLAAKSDAVSCVGHPDTAACLGVACNRVSVSLKVGDELYVAQLVGGRLPEGSTKLPEGFKFKYLLVTIV